MPKSGMIPKAGKSKRATSSTPSTLCSLASTAAVPSPTRTTVQSQVDEVMSQYTFEITFLQGLIKKCYGCGKMYTHAMFNPPPPPKKKNDLVIRQLYYRQCMKEGQLITNAVAQKNPLPHFCCPCEVIHRFSSDQVTLNKDVESRLISDHKLLCSKLQSAIMPGWCS